jgi:O-antigen/teichoic acid export membrane protein
MIGRTASDAAAPATRPLDEPGEIEARFRQSDTLSHRTVGALSWMFVNASGQIALQITVLAVLARLVAPDQFGLVAATVILITFSEIISDCGIGAALIQRAKVTDEHIRTAFTLTALLSIAVWLCVVVGAPAIASFFRLPALTPLIRVGGLAFVIRSLTVGDFLLARRMQFRALAMIELASYAGYAAVAVVLAARGWGAWALVDGQVAAAAIYTGLLWVVVPHPRRPCLDGDAVHDLVSYGGGQFLGRIGNWFAMQGDNFVVGRTLGADALGLYGRSYAMMSLPANLFGQVANEVLFPAMASVQHDREKLRVAFRHSSAVLALLALPASIVVAMLGDETVRVLLGPSWVALETAFSVMVFGMFFRTSYKLSDSLARATGAVYRRAWRQGVYAAAVVGGAFIGHWWGIRGVAFGVLAAVVVNFVLMAHLALELIDMSWSSFAGAHAPALLVTGVLVLTVGPTALLLRALGASSLVILACGVSVAGITSVALIRSAPGLRLTPLTNVIGETLGLVPARAAALAARVCGPAYASFHEVVS